MSEHKTENISYQLNDPTQLDLALAGNFSLSLLLLASGILFFHMAHSSKSNIPHLYTVFISIFLIAMATIFSIVSVYDYIYILNKIEIYCNKNPCVMDDNMLNTHKYVHVIFCIAFVFINIFITYTISAYP